MPDDYKTAQMVKPELEASLQKDFSGTVETVTSWQYSTDSGSSWTNGTGSGINPNATPNSVKALIKMTAPDLSSSVGDKLYYRVKLISVSFL